MLFFSFLILKRAQGSAKTGSQFLACALRREERKSRQIHLFDDGLSVGAARDVRAKFRVRASLDGDNNRGKGKRMG